MHAGADSLKSAVIVIEEGGDAAPPSNGPLSTPATIGTTIADTVPVAEGTTDDDGRPDMRAHVMMLY